MSTDEQKKSRPQEYGFNPVSRRWVKKTSDTWLRLVKAGLVSEDPGLLETLTAKRREAVRDKNQAAVERRAKQLAAPSAKPEPEPKPAPKPEPKAATTQPKKADRAEVRRRVVQVALDNQDQLDGCQDDDELEERLRRLLLWDTHTRGCRGEAPTLAPSAKPRRATHARHRAESDDEETSDY
jgi:hypothetical protein